MTRKKSPLPKQFVHKKQVYHIVGLVPHTMDSGREILLRSLRTNCPDCGKEFGMYATESAIKTRALRRRCDEHKKPGVPVDRSLSKKPERKPKLKKQRFGRKSPEQTPPTEIVEMQATTSPAAPVAPPASQPTNWSQKQSEDTMRAAIGMLVDTFSNDDSDEYTLALGMLE